MLIIGIPHDASAKAGPLSGIWVGRGADQFIILKTSRCQLGISGDGDGDVLVLTKTHPDTHMPVCMHSMCFCVCRFVFVCVCRTGNRLGYTGHHFVNTS